MKPGFPVHPSVHRFIDVRRVLGVWRKSALFKHHKHAHESLLHTSSFFATLGIRLDRVRLTCTVSCSLCPPSPPKFVLSSFVARVSSVSPPYWLRLPLLQVRASGIFPSPGPALPVCSCLNSSPPNTFLCYVYFIFLFKRRES